MKKTILIIEDEAPLRDALVSKLNLEGFFTFEAKNGEEGLAIALDKCPDLILLDIIMPKMDGITLLRNLRQNEKCKKTEVIMLTNLDDMNKVAEAVEQDSSEYLVKSNIKIEDVVLKVRAKLGV